jgi:hypothetical protein
LALASTASSSLSPDCMSVKKMTRDIACTIHVQTRHTHK